MRASFAVFACLLVLPAAPGCSALVSPDPSRLGGSVEGDAGRAGLDGGAEPVDAGRISPDAYVPPGTDGGPRPDAWTPPDTDAGCTLEPSCSGDELTFCEAGAPRTISCPLGCESARCLEMVPSNVAEDLWRADATDLEIRGATGFDTGTCRAMSAMAQLAPQHGGGREVCVLQVRNLSIAPGAALVVQGWRPLVIMATGDVEIAGILDLSAVGSTAGPGGADGATRSGEDGGGNGPGRGGESRSREDGGGGGAGHCGAGGDGGRGGMGAGGEGHSALSIDMIQPLEGGSGGGAGVGSTYDSGSRHLGGDGGGGGGAVQISARGSIRVSGRILAGGAGGGGGRRLESLNWGSGGGGGSGGAILIEAPEITFAGAILATSGGGGGGSGSSSADGGDGEDGVDAPGFGRARGGLSGGTRYGAAGGASGGGGESDGMVGESNLQSFANGGGGGGGVGCIAVRTRSGSLPAGTSSAWSPSGAGFAVAPVLTR